MNTLAKTLELYRNFKKQFCFYIRACQRWIFNTSTKAIEILAAISAFLIFLVISLSGSEVALVEIITNKYHMIEISHISNTFLIISVILIVNEIPVLNKNVAMQKISGLCLIVFGFMFFVLSILMSERYPPLTFPMLFFPVFSIITAFAGFTKIEMVDKQRQVADE